MKNIALMVPDFFVEHCQEFITGVTEYLADKEVKLFIGNTKFNRNIESLFDYQYWTTTKILKSTQVDGYIFISGVYSANMPPNAFMEFLGKYNDRPVISASIQVDNENCYSVINNCQKSYEEIIHHLKHEHGRKRIAFMSANSTQSSEALGRFEDFKHALASEGLEFYPELVFDGSYIDFLAKNDILKRYKCKDDLDFDALVCANDMMATGSLAAFREIGVDCPKDVSIIGFDDAVYASLSDPKLSTVNQNIQSQGRKCGELIYRVLNGEKIEKTTYTDLQLMFRHSCGCKNPIGYENYYKNIKDEYVEEKRSGRELLNLYLDEILEKRKYASLLDSINDTNTIKQIFYNSRNVLDVMHLDSYGLCLYEHPVYLNTALDYDLPETAEVYMYFDKVRNISNFKTGIKFNPAEKVFPFEEFQELNPGRYIVYPIFSGEANYGYLVCTPVKMNFAAYTVNFMILVKAIAQAVEYSQSLQQAEVLLSQNTELLETNSNLENQTKTDELTKILNRRGFLELGQRMIDVIQEINVPGIVFFADMDGLKIINDTYGHEMGDKAIQLIALVLKKAFRSTDVIGRLSGDEFGVVANGMTIDSIEKMRAKVNEVCKEVSEENNLPFTLSVSLGATDLEPSIVLSRLLSEADKFLYKEKQKKKRRHNG